MNARSAFHITNLKNYENGIYKISIIANVIEYRDVKPTILNTLVDQDKYIFFIHHYKNCIRIYQDGIELPKWELIKVSKEFVDFLEKFPKSGWTGECDYKSYLAADIFEPWPTLSLTEIKKQIEEAEIAELSTLERPETLTRQVSENLRLRSIPNTSGEIVTTIQASTLVCLLKTGENETIEGITAPWVYVETEEGIRGWCFSGYLEEIRKEEPVVISTSVPVEIENTPQEAETEIVDISESDNSIPMIPFVVGGGIVVVAVGIIFVMRRKKK